MGAVFDHKAWAGQSGPLYGDLAVGDITQLKVDGVLTDFIVVHQGIPDTWKYDSSCNGTWLLMRDIYNKKTWVDSGSSNYIYTNSLIHYYLNGKLPEAYGSFIDLLSSKAKNAIKEVYIPATDGGSQTGRGTLAKIFLLSIYELGLTQSSESEAPLDGAKLDYFDEGSGSDTWGKRIATFNGEYCNWWLRVTRRYAYPHYPFYMSVSTNSRTGAVTNCYPNYTSVPGTAEYGVRPCLIMPADQKIIA